MAHFKTLDDLDLKRKRVLLRADLNVPVADGKVTDATRIERIVPTIREIIKVDGKAILLSHFGRPRGGPSAEFSLEQVVPAVANAVGHPVGFVATDWNDVSKARQAIESAPPGSVLVLENTRFHPGEEKNDPELAKRMAVRVSEHATPVGSGTVARTERIPVAARAEAAVVAWMRHQTTAYDHMDIPRIQGARREVRRELAEISRALLDLHRRDAPHAAAGCPLCKAVARPQTPPAA